VSDNPTAQELLGRPDALLTRSHLRELGLGRNAIDAVFRALPVVAIPGYSRPMIRVEDYLALVADHTSRGDRVRPIGLSSGAGAVEGARTVPQERRPSGLDRTPA
jgi:hypothetical protein